MAKEKSYRDRVVFGLVQRASLMEAIRKLVQQRPADPGEPLVNDWACEALTLYHECGRPDVDEVSEMLGVTLTTEYEDALAKYPNAPEFQQALIDAVVSVSTMTVHGDGQDPSAW